MIKKIKLVGAILVIAATSVFALSPVAAVTTCSNCSCKHKVDCDIKGKVSQMSKRMCEKKGGTVKMQADDATK